MANINTINNDLDSLSISKSYKCPPESCSQYLRNPTKNLNILHLNIRSIHKNFDEVPLLMRRLGFHCDILVFSECWLSKVSHLPILDGYTSHFTKNIHNQNDGCVIYIKSTIKHKVIEPHFVDANCLVCHINNITILVLYRSPAFKNIENFIESLDRCLSVPTHSVVLIGDINIDIKHGSNDRNSDEYLSCAASHGLLAAHLYPTRLSNCLDHVLLKTSLAATTFVIETTITDHYPVLLSLYSKQKYINIPCIKHKVDYESVIETINKLNWSHTLSIMDPNEAAQDMINKLFSIVKEHTTECIIPRKLRTLKPWITPGMLRCIRNRDRMHAKLKKTGENEILKITYTRYRNYCNSLLRNLKREYEKSEFTKAKKNTKATWDVIKKVSDLNIQKSSPVELLQLSESPKSSLNLVNDFFTNIGKNLATKLKPATTFHASTCNTSGSMVLMETTVEDVEATILNLRSDCAFGWDGISTTIIKNSKSVLAPIITHVCNLSISHGVFPEVFKRAVVIPIHKTGRRDDVNNYRPISILSAMSKILERILNKSLVSFLVTNKIVSNNQYGFRTGINSEDAILTLAEHVTRSLDKKQKCLGIFLDLTKAFDTVSAPVLLRKMESIGVRGHVLNIFADYLRNRTQIVKIGQYESDELPISYGVPQGSILGPTLFLIYINELCQLPIEHCKIISYADDTTLLIDGTNWSQCYHNAEVALISVMKWLADNLLTLNVSKTVYIPFAIKSNLLPQNSLSLKAHLCTSPTNCDCMAISRSNIVKYLGIYVDQYLNWQKHIDTLSSRTRKLIYVFKKLRSSADRSTLIMVYQSLCQSILTYCVPVWGGATKNSIIRLERAQRAVLKVLLSRPRRYPTEQLYAECEMLTVRQLYVFHSIIRKHSSRPTTEPAGRVKHKIFPLEPHNTTFAERQFYMTSSKIYNLVNKYINIYPTTTFRCKTLLKAYLLKLNYQKTEDLLSRD